MPDMKHGYIRAVTVVVMGFVIGIILSKFKSVGLISPSYLLLLNAIFVLMVISLILAMPYWGTGYLMGWLIGIILLAEIRIVGISDILFYFVIPLFIMAMRIYKKYS